LKQEHFVSHNGHNAPENTKLLGQLLSQDGTPSQVAPNGSVAPPASQSEATGGFAQLVKRLPQAKELFIAAGILLGPAGYLVKARFFAPYGLVPPVEFHLQYIVDGILFMIFCTICLFPIRYAIDIAVQKPSKVALKTTFYQLWRFSRGVLFAIFVIITALVSLTGPIVILPGSTPPSQLSLSGMIIQSLASSALVVLAFAIAPLFKQRRKVKSIIQQKDNLKPILWLFVAYIVLFLIFSCFVMLFMAIFNVNVLLLLLNSVLITLYFVWFPMFVYVLMVSAIFVAQMIFHYGWQIGLASPVVPKEDTLNNNVLYRYAGAVGSWSVVIALLASFYVINVYPLIPQSIGGGKSANISVLLDTSSVYHNEVSAPDTAAYLLLRTSEKTFLRLENKQTSTSKMIEVPNDDIKGITYLPPTP
jgi:hypothetical protein